MKQPGRDIKKIIRIEKNDLKSQVRQGINRYIEAMDLTASNKLPREEELAKMLGVSRITLRSVLDEMSADGIIFRKHGKGTFVNPVFYEMQVSFNPVLHFSDMIRNSGYTPDTKTLHYGVERADQETAGKLHIALHTPVFTCVKAFYADRKMCAIVHDFIPLDVIGEPDPSLFKRFDESLFYYIYNKSGRKIVWDKVEIDVACSGNDAFLHEYMKENTNKEKAFLLLRGVNFDQDDREILYAKEYIDTSILKFTQIRKREIDYQILD